MQEAINAGLIVSGHDISSGGLIVTLLESCFAQNEGGIALDLTPLSENDPVKLLFSENPGVIVQVTDAEKIEYLFKQNNIACIPIGKPMGERVIQIKNFTEEFTFEIDSLREKWFRPLLLARSKTKW